MTIQTIAPTVRTSISLSAYDKATNALDKAEAILSTISSAFDDEHGFIATDQTIWLTVLASRDLVDEARGSLTADK